MHCMYSGMAKGTSRAKAMLNSEKIKIIALAISYNAVLQAKQLPHPLICIFKIVSKIDLAMF